MMLRSSGIPSFAKEGWLRHKEKWPRSLIGTDGGAKRASPIGRSHKEWLFKPPIIQKACQFDKRWLETTILYGYALSGLRASRPRPLLSKDASRHFSLCRVHPSFAKEGSSSR